VRKEQGREEVVVKEKMKRKNTIKVININHINNDDDDDDDGEERR